MSLLLVFVLLVCTHTLQTLPCTTLALSTLRTSLFIPPHEQMSNVHATSAHDNCLIIVTKHCSWTIVAMLKFPLVVIDFESWRCAPRATGRSIERVHLGPAATGNGRTKRGHDTKTCGARAQGSGACAVCSSKKVCSRSTGNLGEY